MLKLALVTSFYQGKIIQWLGHIMRKRETETVRVGMETTREKV